MDQPTTKEGPKPSAFERYDLSVKVWHIVISGFLQKFGEMNGIVKLWRQIHNLLSDNGRMDRSVVVKLSSWNDNFETLAEGVSRLEHPDTPPVVYVYAYSWGAGGGAVNLARALKERGIDIHLAIFADPIYYSAFAPFRWLAIFSGKLFAPPRITVPYGIKKVIAYRQNRSVPAGHELRAESDLTDIQMVDDKSGRRHEYMDDSPDFQKRCLQAVRELHQIPA